jgi:hypothetical protein
MTPAFEQFARSKGWPTWRKPDGLTYIDTRVQFASEAWQALGTMIRPALIVARTSIREERDSVLDSHHDPKTGKPDALGREAADMYDEILAGVNDVLAFIAAPQQPASLGGGV